MIISKKKKSLPQANSKIRKSMEGQRFRIRSTMPWLCQGTTSVVPQTPQEYFGFSR
jgi:hypothetical protein